MWKFFENLLNNSFIKNIITIFFYLMDDFNDFLREILTNSLSFIKIFKFSSYILQPYGDSFLMTLKFIFQNLLCFFCLFNRENYGINCFAYSCISMHILLIFFCIFFCLRCNRSCLRWSSYSSSTNVHKCYEMKIVSI